MIFGNFSSQDLESFYVVPHYCLLGFGGLFRHSAIPPFRLLGQPNGNILQSFGHLNVLYFDCVKLMTPQVRQEGTGRAGTGHNGNGRDGGSQVPYVEQIHALTRPLRYDCYRTSEFLSFVSLSSTFIIQYLLLLYGSVSQGLGTTKFTNLIG